MKEFVKKYDLGNWAIAIFAAFLLWMVAVSGDNSDISNTYIVPLQVTGQNTLAATELNIINTLPERVTIRVSGPPDKVNQLGPKNTVTNKISAKLDLSSIYQSGDYKLNYDVSFEVDSISVEQKSPSQITVAVDRIVTESIPVEIDFTGKVQQDFNIESYSLSIPKVDITGPQRYVDMVARAAVEIDRSGLHENVEVEGNIVLYDAEGKEYIHDQLTQHSLSTVFTASMKKTKTVELKVNKIITDDMITDEMMSVTVAPQTIQVWGDKNAVDALNEVILGEISAVKCIESETFEYVLPVQLPEGVSADVTDLAATVSVEFNGIEKVTMNIPVESLPMIEGYENVNTEGIEIVMYAKSEDIEKITNESFKLFPIYSQDEYDQGTLTQVDMRVVCLDYDVMILGEYIVEVNKVIEE